jgi:hypothetical protein
VVAGRLICDLGPFSTTKRQLRAKCEDLTKPVGFSRSSAYTHFADQLFYGQAVA